MGRIRTAAVGGLVEDNPLAAAATTLTSAGLAALPLFGASDFALVMFDPNGRTGEPFAKRITAHGTNAVSATIDAAAIYGTAREIRQGVPWRLTDILDQDGNGSGLIGFTEYFPAADTIFTTSGTSYTAVDTTNLRVSFTVPPSGKVLTRLTASSQHPGGTSGFWAMLEGAANVADHGRVRDSATGVQRLSSAKLVTGLTPGAAKSWDWAHRTQSGTFQSVIVGQGASFWGPAVMEVWAVNV